MGTPERVVWHNAPALRGQARASLTFLPQQKCRPQGASISSLVLKMLCIFGIHDEAAEFVDQETCVVRKKCRRCSREKLRLEHAGFGAWRYERPGDCRARRECTRCGAWETGLQHQRDESGEARQACSSIRYCARCGNRVVENLEGNVKDRALS